MDWRLGHLGADRLGHGRFLADQQGAARESSAERAGHRCAHRAWQCSPGEAMVEVDGRPSTRRPGRAAVTGVPRATVELPSARRAAVNAPWSWFHWSTTCRRATRTGWRTGGPMRHEATQWPAGLPARARHDGARLGTAAPGPAHEMPCEAACLRRTENGGGHTSQLVAEKLARVITGGSRHGASISNLPRDAPTGTVITVTDENAGSDGDIVTASDSRRGIGPVVGSAPGAAWSASDLRYQLVDGSTVTHPLRSWMSIRAGAWKTTASTRTWRCPFRRRRGQGRIRS